MMGKYVISSFSVSHLIVSASFVMENAGSVSSFFVLRSSFFDYPQDPPFKSGVGFVGFRKRSFHQ